MSVVVIGLNHRTASLDLLERLTVGDDALAKALRDLSLRPNLSEAVVLSTCNRTEVYAVAERFHGGYHDIREWLSELGELHPEDFHDHLYVHYDEAAVAHLFTVAAGLDSAVVGEHEILGQVAAAWGRARDEGTAGRAAQPAVPARHRGRQAGADRDRHRPGDRIGLPGRGRHGRRAASARSRAARVLLLGAGDMAEGMAVALAGAGVDDIVVANRTHANAVALARRIGGRPARMDDLADELVAADVLLTSTGATAAIIDHTDIEAVMERRAGRPLLIVDIAVPRDVDPAAESVPGVTLLDMDDLRGFAEVGLAARRHRGAPGPGASWPTSSTATRARPPPGRRRRSSRRSATAPRTSAGPSWSGSPPGLSALDARRAGSRRGAHPRRGRQAAARTDGAAEERGRLGPRRPPRRDPPRPLRLVRMSSPKRSFGDEPDGAGLRPARNACWRSTGKAGSIADWGAPAGASAPQAPRHAQR